MPKKYAKRATTEAFFNFIEQPRRKVEIEEEFSSHTYYEKRHHPDVESANLWCVNGTRFMQAVHYFKRGTNPPNPVNIPFGDSLKDWRGSKDLSQEYGVSVQSINNDLKKLEALGLVERSYQWVELPTTAFNMRIWRFVPNAVIPPFVERIGYAHTTHKIKAARQPKQTQVFADDPYKFVGCEMWRRRELWSTYPDLGWLAD